MTQLDWQRYFWRNTFTNYLRTALRLGSGIILFRLTYQHLDAQAFGFYALLWSLFGYTVLLDFGLGFATQKAVAVHAADGDTARLNQLLSTIFWSFVGLAVVLALVAVGAARPFLIGLKIQPDELPLYHAAYLVFFAALAVNFPLALFGEVLRGRQRIDLLNAYHIFGLLLNLGLLSWALLTKQSLFWVMAISVGTTILPNLLCLATAPRLIAGLSLHPRAFHPPSLGPVLGFSLVAYCITFTHLIMARSDQLIIGFGLGLAAVALYQAGYKVAEMFNMAALQMQDALSPAAAHLQAKQDQAGLRNLLVRTTRLTALLSLFLYTLAALYLEPCSLLLTGLKELPREAYWVGQALLLATLSSLLSNSCSKRILMMCGEEKRLLRFSLAEAGSNVALSVALLPFCGILGVAIGTLIPTVFFGWSAINPLAARFCGLSLSGFMKEVYRPLLRVLLALVLGAAVCGGMFPLTAAGLSTWSLLMELAWRTLLIVSLVAVAGGRQWKILLLGKGTN